MFRFVLILSLLAHASAGSFLSIAHCSNSSESEGDQPDNSVFPIGSCLPRPAAYENRSLVLEASQSGNEITANFTVFSGVNCTGTYQTNVLTFPTSCQGSYTAATIQSTLPIPPQRGFVRTFYSDSLCTQITGFRYAGHGSCLNNDSWADASNSIEYYCFGDAAVAVNYTKSANCSSDSKVQSFVNVSSSLCNAVTSADPAWAQFGGGYFKYECVQDGKLPEHQTKEVEHEGEHQNVNYLISLVIGNITQTQYQDW